MIRVGTSGWSYRHWKEPFYGKTPQRQWLAFISRRMTALELNGTHYRTPALSTLQAWREAVPADFHFAAKGHRYITHSLKLKNAEAALARQKRDLAPLGDRLKVMLWQMPRSFSANMERLESFLDALQGWGEVRHALEFRNASWFTDDVAHALERAAVANVISDAADWPRWDCVTSGLAYVRLHGAAQTYVSDYAPASLKQWASRVTAWQAGGADAYVFFDNDSEAAAPRNALAFMDSLRDSGAMPDL